MGSRCQGRKLYDVKGLRVLAYIVSRYSATWHAACVLYTMHGNVCWRLHTWVLGPGLGTALA